MSPRHQQQQQQIYHHHHRLFHHYNHHNRSPSPTLSSSSSSAAAAAATANEKSPFLIVKILLFSLMTIDFAMNTIGLAVIIVIVKNHYNNFIVERSFIIRSELVAAASPAHTNHHVNPFSSSHHHHQQSLPLMGNGDIPTGDFLSSSSANQQSEWSLLLPLLPSFIFAEILTLIGMFGVFCDLFSFTMTYAILKLITSLCYPSMASVAAVAAMASATSSSASSPSSLLFNSAFPLNPINLSTTTTMAPSLVPIVLPFPVNDNDDDDDGTNVTRTTNMTITNTKTTTIKPTAHIFYDLQSNIRHRRVLHGGIGDLSLKSLPLIINKSDISINSSDDVVDQELIDQKTITTTPLPISANNDEDDDDDDDRRFTTSKPANEQNDTKIVGGGGKNQLNNNPGWLKTYEMMLNNNKDLRQMKKSDRLAKLKAREKQIRNRLLRLETIDTKNGYESNKQNDTNPQALSPQPLIFDGHHYHQHYRYRQPQPSMLTVTNNLLNQQQQQQRSMATMNNPHYRLLSSSPIDSSHQQQQTNYYSSNHIKYHHRVWDALLVTFEVIFAVAFAFNLLSHKRGAATGTNHRQQTSGGLFEDGYFLDPIVWDDIDVENNGDISNTGSSSLTQQQRRLRGHIRNSGHYRNGNGRQHYHNYSSSSTNFWPYSPLATSIDAFYFAYFRLPPPPPSYFCQRNISALSSTSTTTMTTTTTTRPTAAVPGTVTTMCVAFLLLLTTNNNN
ncbi:uncharacterized protein LOC124496749 [Dermatophagoides farinae]|uniref:uncharacterized protein LOC124496749 n=1 Tax=Dermatophagoides farinae TaxID=6954 RepID=UPI003F638F7F